VIVRLDFCLFITKAVPMMYPSNRKQRRNKGLESSKSRLLRGAVSFGLEALESRRLLSASISGTVYNDANGNHVRDAGEVAVVGQQVYLDLQGIDKFVAGDPVATTDANGAYSFTGLAAGNYLVRPVPVAGKVTTTPIWGGKFFVQLGANQDVTGDDFGIQDAATPNFTVNGQLLIAGTATGQATLTRYNIADGSIDVTFGLLGMVTLPNTVTGTPTAAVAQGANTAITYPTQIVTLDSAGDVVSITPTGPISINAPTNLVATATSSHSVNVTFSDNATNEDQYIFERSNSANGPWTTVYTIGGTAGTGTEGFSDVTVAPGTTYFYRVHATQGANQSAYAGPVSVTTPVATGGATISGTVRYNFGNEQVYLDLNGIGTYVNGDPIVTTDAQGNYSFTGLQPANYLVRIKPQSGWFTITPVWGGKYFVQLGANQVVTGDDFQVIAHPSLPVGNQLLTYGVSAYTGISSVQLFNADGTTDVTFGGVNTALGAVDLPSSVTGNPSNAVVQPNGNIVVTYPASIVTLSASGAIVSITPVTGQTLNAPTGLTATATSPTSVRIDFMDNSTNEDTFVLERSTSATGPFSLVADIGGFGGGGGIAGTGPVSFIDTTAQANTTYYYRVYAMKGFGLQSAIAGPVSVTTPAVGTGGATIAGTVFNDGNGDNMQFPNSGIAGAHVYLDLQGIDQFVPGDPIVTADVNGNYIFTGLNPGNYIVRPVVPAGDVITGPIFGGKYFVQLAANQNVTGDGFGLYAIPATHFTVNGQLIVAPNGLGPSKLRRFNSDGSIDVGFGTYGTVTLPASVTDTPTAIVGQPNGSIVATYASSIVTLGGDGTILSITAATGASISGTVFNDANNNGTQDAGELPVNGRQVYLDLQGIGVFASGDPITTTDAGGHYSFAGLSAANYLVRLIQQSGTVITAPVYGGKYYVPLAANQVVTGDNFGTQSATDTVIHNVSLTNGQLLIARPQFIDLTIQNSSKAAIVTRYNSDGSVDTTFGSTGSISIPLTTNFSFVASFPKGLLQLLNGNTLVVTEAGHLSNTNSDDTEMAVIHPAGKVIRAVTVSSHSGSTGSASGDFVDAFSIAPDGKILAAGHHSSVQFSNSTPDTLVVWRYNIDLAPDLTFGTNGRVDIASVIGTPTAVTGLAGGGVKVSYSNTSVTLSSTGQLN
jgi:uncharacterized delta-60 repeat protein